MKLTRRTRPAFTLVELMVAAAMSIAGMWLLTWLYQQGLESFRQARAQAELMSGERAVAVLLERDLKQNHFLDEDSKPNRGRRLSDQRLDRLGYDKFPNPTSLQGYTPPRGGYFYARSKPADNLLNFFEATDTNLFDSSRSTNHVLAFTVILPGGSNAQQFGALVPVSSSDPNNPPKQYFGTAAEVVYYLKQNGQTPGGVPLYDLYRQQRLCALSDDDAPAYDPAFAAAAAVAPPAVEAIGEVMVPKTPPTRIGTLKDLTIPRPPIGTAASVRLPAPPASALGTFRFGEDKMMSGVLSFEVKFTGSSPQSNWTGINWPTPFPANSDYPYDFLPYNGEFDTYTTQVTGWNDPNNLATTAKTTQVLKPLRITGAQIRIRAYDSRTRATRQTTITVDL